MSDKTKLLGWLVVGALLVLVASLVGGCAAKPRAKAGQASAMAPADPGTPAFASSGSSVAMLPVPAGSTVETVPGKPAEAGKPGEPAQVKVTLAAPSELRVESHGEASSTGTVDATVAVKKAELAQASADRAPLLWAAIASLVAGVVFVVMKWPGVATVAFVAAGCFFAAWKLAEVPWWAGLLAVVAGAALFLGYKRGEWDADGNGTPDFLERGQK
jgi:hypothetical protein